MALPVNFEEKVKVAPAPGGAGYPYRISARDLMRDFVYAAVEVPSFTDQSIRNGIKEIYGTGDNGHTNRSIYAEPFPENPASGDIMYYDGAEWVSLAAPSGSGVFVLTHNGTVPSWTATEECV
jgi:hypothetical protein